MIKKEITYTDYDGNKRTESFYFNLNKLELAEMEVSASGGFDKFLKRIVETEDEKEILGMMKEMILKSYGKKSDDGRRFTKTQELRDEFSQTEAFVELFLEIGNSAEAASAFVRGIVPPEFLQN